MDFSAFLGLSMKKKKDQPKLRTVDESSEGEVSPLIHNPMYLDGGNQGDGGKGKTLRLEVKDRSELKFRTYEPELKEFAEPLDDSLEDEWNSTGGGARIHKGLWISIGLLLVAGLGWLIFKISQTEPVVVTELMDTQSLIDREEQIERDALQTITSIREVVVRFYESSSVDEMLKYVRHPERVGPLMKDYYAKHPLQASELTAVSNLNPLTIGNRGGFWVVLSELDSGVGKLVVEVKSPTEVKVDWETHVCYQPIDWEQFVKERPTGYHSNFRVYVEREDFYNYEFADSKKYQAFRISTLNSYEVIFGYAERDGEVFRVLDNLLTNNGNKKVPVMLRLYLQEGLLSKSGVLIDEVIAPRWLFVDSPEVDE
jgi:hypothetical protein